MLREAKLIQIAWSLQQFPGVEEAFFVAGGWLTWQARPLRVHASVEAMIPTRFWREMP